LVKVHQERGEAGLRNPVVSSGSRQKLADPVRECTGEGISLWRRLWKKELQGIPGAAAQIGKKIPVIEKIPPQDLRDPEDYMSVGNILEYVGAEPFSEFGPRF
jgi:hypothetical protein